MGVTVLPGIILSIGFYLIYGGDVLSMAVHDP